MRSVTEAVALVRCQQGAHWGEEALIFVTCTHDNTHGNTVEGSAGNTLGCLGLLFALSESWSVWVLDERAPNAPFWLPTVLAGACAGGVYRAPRGPKAAAITATVGAMAGAGLCSLRLFLPGL
jgi:hypothetical protein